MLGGLRGRWRQKEAEANLAFGDVPEDLFVQVDGKHWAGRAKYPSLAIFGSRSSRNLAQGSRVSTVRRQSQELPASPKLPMSSDGEGKGKGQGGGGGGSKSWRRAQTPRRDRGDGSYTVCDCGK